MARGHHDRTRLGSVAFLQRPADSVGLAEQRSVRRGGTPRERGRRRRPPPVVARYTIENLILNAVHEIGEWLRSDGEGSSRRIAPEPRQVEFGAAAHRPVAGDQNGRMLLLRLAEAAAPSRFTYLPGTTILYEPAGPAIRWSGGELMTVWHSTWSMATREAGRPRCPSRRRSARHR